MKQLYASNSKPRCSSRLADLYFACLLILMSICKVDIQYAIELGGFHPFACKIMRCLLHFASKSRSTKMTSLMGECVSILCNRVQIIPTTYNEADTSCAPLRDNLNIVSMLLIRAEPDKDLCYGKLISTHYVEILQSQYGPTNANLGWIAFATKE